MKWSICNHIVQHCKKLKQRMKKTEETILIVIFNNINIKFNKKSDSDINIFS